MTKKPDLREAMLKPRRQSVEEISPPEHRSGRAGKSNVTGYFAPEVKRQLRILAAEEDTSIQALLGEALNELFAKYGKPEIAPQRAARMRG